MSTSVASYTMNPAEDVILFGDELREGMWILPEDRLMRGSVLDTEEEQLRRQRFRKITGPIQWKGLRENGIPTGETVLIFIGEWVDGYQEVHRYNASWAWLVKRDSLPASPGETP